MGPLLVSSGDVPRRPQSRLLGDASMGPLLVSSGDPVTAVTAGASGSSFNGAAAGEQRRPGREIVAETDLERLQWGRCW